MEDEIVETTFSPFSFLFILYKNKKKRFNKPNVLVLAKAEHFIFFKDLILEDGWMDGWVEKPF